LKLLISIHQKASSTRYFKKCIIPINQDFILKEFHFKNNVLKNQTTLFCKKKCLVMEIRSLGLVFLFIFPANSEAIKPTRRKEIKVFAA